MVSTPGSGARSFRCKNAAARAERSPRIFTMCAISGARAGAGAGAAFGRSPGSPAAPASPRMAPPAPRRAPTAPRKRRRPSPSPREPSAGEGARCHFWKLQSWRSNMSSERSFFAWSWSCRVWWHECGCCASSCLVACAHSLKCRAPIL